MEMNFIVVHMSNSEIGEKLGESYPSRVKRTVMVADLMEMFVETGALILCGRVVGLLDGENGLEVVESGSEGERGFILQDVSGRLMIGCEELPNVGDIVQAEVMRTDGGGYELKGKLLQLAGCTDFFVSALDSPNYKKMVIDEHLRSNLNSRGMVLSLIRQFFVQEGFVETETPCLVKSPGMEPYLDVFKTKFQANLTKEKDVEQDMYLITSPEYSLKKLLSGGMEKIFQITKTFRNKETFSERHNPEFTMLEWYRAYASYEEMIDDTERLVKFVWEHFCERRDNGGPGKLKWGAHEVDVMGAWTRMTVLEAFRDLAGVDEDVFFDVVALRKLVKGKGYAVSDGSGFDDLFFTLFLNEIEPNLGINKPVILCDYPVSMAALSKKCAEDVRFAERFEVYIAGVELCNGFTELNDPVEQESRLLAEKEERRVLGKDLYDIDAEFIEALKFGMPPSGGNALGIDRLIMLILGEIDINNTLYFPYRDL
jgi:elongation factor P--(R)-beta-lysine ligase